MAGFTSMALLAGGLLAGAVGTRLAMGKREGQQQPTLAPGPADTTQGQTLLTPPAPPIVNPADANNQANQAATRQRKRAARGSLLTNPISTSTTAPVAPRLNQRTLLGS